MLYLRIRLQTLMQHSISFLTSVKDLQHEYETTGVVPEEKIKQLLQPLVKQSPSRTEPTIVELVQQMEQMLTFTGLQANMPTSMEEC
jgi:hypothetical protein